MCSGKYTSALRWAREAIEYQLSPSQKCYLALLFAKLADHPDGMAISAELLAQAAKLLEQAQPENPNALQPLRENTIFKKYQHQLFPIQ